MDRVIRVKEADQRLVRQRLRKPVNSIGLIQKRRCPMKKFILILAILTITASAIADVNITMTSIGDGWVNLRYDASEENDRPRAFNLDISVTAGTIDE